MIAAVAIWGISWLPLRDAVATIDPWYVAVARVGGGAIALVAYLLIVKRRFTADISRRQAIAGLAQIGGVALGSTLALARGGVSTTAILLFTMPVWAVVFAAIMLRERIATRSRWSLALSTLGIACTASGLTFGELPAALEALAAGAAWGFGAVLQRSGEKRGDAVSTVAWQQLLVAVPLAVFARSFGHAPVRMTLASGFDLAFLALLGSGAAWVWWTQAAETESTTTIAIAIASFSIPLIGTALAALQTFALPSARTLLGLGIVSLGIFVATVPLETFFNVATRDAPFERARTRGTQPER